MMNSIENLILKQNAKAIKYIHPSQFESDEINEVNKQVNRDFGLVGPIVLSQPSTRVHRLRWAMVREVFVVETHVRRLEKELVASGVSRSNLCPYCVDVHATSIQSLDDNYNKDAMQPLVEWSLNTKNPSAEMIQHPPFSREKAPEIIGTALEFHSTNRLVSIFLEESPLPNFVSRMGMKKIALFFASKTFFKSMVMKTPKAGGAQKFLDESTPTVDYDWASSLPLYGLIRSANKVVLQDIENECIPASVALLFKQHLADWNGEDMPMGRAWLKENVEGLNKKEAAIANILFLAAFSPHMMTENDISMLEKNKHRDTLLVELCFWAIQMLTFRIEAWLTAPFKK